MSREMGSQRAVVELNKKSMEHKAVLTALTILEELKSDSEYIGEAIRLLKIKSERMDDEIWDLMNAAVGGGGLDESAFL